MLNTIAIKNYRSIRELIIPLTSLNVVTGANGAGKSNSIERSAYLPKQQWVGRCHPSWKRGARFLSLGRARKGGSSARPSCGGPGPAIECLAATWLLGGRGRLSLGFGLPEPVPRTQFGLDPEIKREAIFHSAFTSQKVHW